MNIKAHEDWKPIFDAARKFLRKDWTLVERLMNEMGYEIKERG